MKSHWLRTLANRPWLRVGLVVILIMVGLAPIGAPILSDSSWRTTMMPNGQNVPAAPQPQAFTYRLGTQDEDRTRVERSVDGGRTWQTVANIPAEITELTAVPADEQVVYSRNKDAVWMSRDGGATWTRTGQLPSRPMSLAVTGKASATVLVGTESVGLTVSRDGGETWQIVNDPTLSMNAAASIAVTALKVNPEDETIMYAATAVWTGTSAARLNPVGTFVSVDGGRLWTPIDALPLTGGVATGIHPVEGQPLAVVTENSRGSFSQALKVSPELIDGLSSADPAVRSSVARILGLAGDPTATKSLLDRLNDPDTLVGDQVAEALGRLGDEGVVDALVTALGSDREAVRARAAYALGLLKHEAAVDLLAARLREDSPMVARRAAEALANIGTPDALGGLVVPLAEAEMTSARHAAMIGLELADAQATHALVTALNSQNPALRTHAAEMLGWIKPAEAVGALATALQDSEPAVRVQAAWALGEIANTEAQNALAKAKNQAVDDMTKTAVVTAYQRSEQMTYGNHSAETFVDTLLGRLSGVPATSWTFFALFLVFAVALLRLTPRPEPMYQR